MLYDINKTDFKRFDDKIKNIEKVRLKINLFLDN